jgi:myo-inositol-1(or 4)-monophosphatase
MATAAPTDASLLSLLHEAADAVAETLGTIDDWSPSGTRAGQYRADLATDAAALRVLERAGVGVLSEESGRHRPAAAVTVVLDPLDGSTNASRGIPWYATSLCAVDADGPRAAVVVNQASGLRYEAVRGGGARCDGVTLTPSGCVQVGEAVVALSGWPPADLGWRQYRALGAAALALCAVASGQVDGYVDCVDYLCGLLVCREAGAPVADAAGRELVTLGPDDRRTPVAAATPELLEQLLVARAAAMGDTIGRTPRPPH